MRALDVATTFENLRAKQWPAFQVDFLSPPQLKNSSDNENTVNSTAFWLSVWKKWCSEMGIAKEIVCVFVLILQYCFLADRIVIIRVEQIPF